MHLIDRCMEQEALKATKIRLSDCEGEQAAAHRIEKELRAELRAIRSKVCVCERACLCVGKSFTLHVCACVRAGRSFVQSSGQFD